jgi:hypothetical protein
MGISLIFGNETLQQPAEKPDVDPVIFVFVLLLLAAALALQFHGLVQISI